MTGDKLVNAAKWVKPMQKYTDVIIHGSPDSFRVLRDGKWLTIDQRSLATYIQKSADYKGGPIRLISCETGKLSSGIAKELANKLGTEVMVPSDTVWIYPNGKITIGQTATSNIGTWNTFMPGN